MGPKYKSILDVCLLPLTTFHRRWYFSKIFFCSSLSKSINPRTKSGEFVDSVCQTGFLSKMDSLGSWGMVEETMVAGVVGKKERKKDR